MRVAPAIHLSREAEAELHRLVRRRTTPVRVVERCQIVLLAAAGLQDKQIADHLSVAPLMASRWRNRSLGQGVAGLLKDAPRPGRTPTITLRRLPMSSPRPLRARPPMLRNGRAVPWHAKRASLNPAWAASGEPMD